MTVCGEKVTGVCVLGKCPHFKRCHPVVWDKYGKIKPKTNEEWRKTCSAKEFAEWIVRIVDCEFCPVKKPCKKQPCKKQIETWLKQPHTEKE